MQKRTDMLLEIRLARIEEAAVIHQIIQAAFAEYVGVIPVVPEASLETLAEIEHDTNCGKVILALIGTTAIGTVRYHLYPEHLHVSRLAVLPDYRGCGIGVELMHYLEKIAPTLGRNILRLSSTLYIFGVGEEQK